MGECRLYSLGPTGVQSQAQGHTSLVFTEVKKKCYGKRDFNYSTFFLFVFFLGPHRMACGILVP